MASDSSAGSGTRLDQTRSET